MFLQLRGKIGRYGNDPWWARRQLLSESSRYIHSTFPGQSQVTDHDIGLKTLGGLARLRAIKGHLDLLPLLPE